MIKLALFLQREGGIARTLILPLSVGAGVTRGLLIVLINAALVSSVPSARLVASAGGMLVIYMACFYFARTSTQKFVERMQSALRLKLLAMVNRADASFLFNLQSGNLQNTLTSDIHRIANYSAQLFADLQAFILVLFCLGYTFWISALAGLVAVAAFCPAALTCLLCDVRARPRIAQAQRTASRFLDLVIDTVRGFKELHLNRAKREALESDVSVVLDEVRDYSVRAEKLITLSTMTAQIGMFGVIGSIIFILPLAGLLSRAEAIEILTITLFAYGPLDALLSRYSSLTHAKVALTRLQALKTEFAERTNDASPAQNLQPKLAEFRTLALEGVSVTLPAVAPDPLEPEAAQPSGFTLGPLDLTIERGQIVFLHGDNGSGKTTLLTLICGLRRPDTGRVLVNGTLTPASELGPLFSAVFADFHLFHRFYGLSPQARAKLGGYITQLGLSNRVKIDDGWLETQALSSGQRRRLALSIALAECRPILLLDEFVADQDPFYRAYFYERLLPQLRAEGTTIIAVTNDESRLHLSDRLFKMADGELHREAMGTIAARPAIRSAQLR